MVTDTLRSRVDEALRKDPAGATLMDLAVSLREEGVDQVTLYRLFTEYYARTAGDDPLCDSLYDTLTCIWSGPWAKGAGLFEKELADADVA